MIGFLAAMVFGIPRLAKGSEIFDIDLLIGNGSVTGTITTDGTFGTVLQSDILGLDLTISGSLGVDPVTFR